jgi:YbgC/YbaW family acyl-CoA thioester hydrolase
MARIKIKLPEKFSFACSIPVRITDLNYGGHVGNDAMLSLIHEIRVQFLRHFGYEEMKIAGVGLIMSDVAIEFKNELFYGDVIEAKASAADFSRVGFDIVYVLQTIKNQKPVTAATAKTGMVCYDYERKKITGVPEEVKRMLTED